MYFVFEHKHRPELLVSRCILGREYIFIGKALTEEGAEEIIARRKQGATFTVYQRKGERPVWVDYKPAQEDFVEEWMYTPKLEYEQRYTWSVAKLNELTLKFEES